MKTTVNERYMVCQDCFDYSYGHIDVLDDTAVIACGEGFDRERKALMKNDPELGTIHSMTWVGSDDEEPEEFSVNSCEVCGSRLGGKRFPLWAILFFD